MKLIFIAVALAGGAKMIEPIYQQHVISEAQGHLTAWIEKKGPLFSPKDGEIERACREHCTKGVIDIEVAEAEWTHVEFLVSNSEHMTFLVVADKRDGDWVAQGTPTGWKKSRTSH